MTRSLLPIVAAVLIAAVAGCGGADNANPKAAPSATGVPAGLKPAVQNGAAPSKGGQAAPPAGAQSSGAVNVP